MVASSAKTSRARPSAVAAGPIFLALDRKASTAATGAAAEIENAADEEVVLELQETERNFINLSDRLHDVGVNGVAIRAWEKARGTSPRLTLH